MIPEQLKDLKFKFILLKQKIPFEKDWQKTANYSYNDPKLLNHIKNGGNYGVLGGYGGLIIIDFDNKKLQEEKKTLLPKTFTVKAGGGLSHMYYICDNPHSFKLLDPEKNTLADIQGKGKQIVGAGSIHPNGNKYEIINNTDIAFINFAEIKAVFAEYLPKESTEHKKQKTDSDIELIKLRISIPDLLKDYNININKNPTCCPMHSSKGGKCLSYNDAVYNCFHCDSKGDIFNFVMDVEKVDFITAKKKLAKKAGIELKVKEKETTFKIEYKSVSEILSQPIPEPKWRVDELIPEAGVTYIASPPGEGKTMLAIYLAQCLAANKPFLDKKVLSGKVAYWDAENGEICLYNRFKDIAAGNDFEDNDLKDCVISVFPEVVFSMDKQYLADRARFKEFLAEVKPDILVLDSLVRFMTGSENDSESCKQVFDFLKAQLKENPHQTIIILHHLSKKHNGGMNALRGSSEIAAAASTILILTRLYTCYRLTVEKSRYLDMTKNYELYYKMEDNDSGLAFIKTEFEGGPSDAIGLAEQDFWQWVKDEEIETFRSKTAENQLKTKKHSKNAIFVMLKDLLKKGYLSKPRRGLYCVDEKPFVDEETVE